MWIWILDTKQNKKEYYLNWSVFNDSLVDSWLMKYSIRKNGDQKKWGSEKMGFLFVLLLCLCAPNMGKFCKTSCQIFNEFATNIASQGDQSFNPTGNQICFKQLNTEIQNFSNAWEMKYVKRQSSFAVVKENCSLFHNMLEMSLRFHLKCPEYISNWILSWARLEGIVMIAE